MIIRYLISVRNIPWTVSHLEFEKYFSAFGSIKNARVIFNKHGLSTGHGFVEFYDAEAMNKALRKSHVLEEEKLSVAVGIEHLQEEGLIDSVNYIQESTQRTGEYVNEQYTQDETVIDKKTNKFANAYRRKLFDKDEPSVIKDLLRTRNTLR